MKKHLLSSIILSLALAPNVWGITPISDTASDPASAIESPSTSWLGVWIEPLSPVLSKHLSPLLKANQGLIIKQISAHSPAETSGLLIDDILTNINGEAIYSQQQLVNTIHNSQPGTTVKLELIREGEKISKDVVLTQSPEKNRIGATPKSFSHHFPRQSPFKHPDWFNEPFFHQGFGNSFFEQQMKQMQQQLNQLSQQQQHLFSNQKKQFRQQNSWSQFESIQIESKDNNQHRAVVRYDDGKGNKKEFVFEGQLSDIRKQISENKEMAADKKQSLLQALDMNNTPAIPFGH